METAGVIKAVGLTVIVGFGVGETLFLLPPDHLQGGFIEQDAVSVSPEINTAITYFFNIPPPIVYSMP